MYLYKPVIWIEPVRDVLLKKVNQCHLTKQIPSKAKTEIFKRSFKLLMSCYRMLWKYWCRTMSSSRVKVHVWASRELRPCWRVFLLQYAASARLRDFPAWDPRPWLLYRWGRTGLCSFFCDLLVCSPSSHRSAWN